MCGVLCICESSSVGGRTGEKRDREERIWRFTDINSLQPCVPMSRDNIDKT